MRNDIKRQLQGKYNSFFVFTEGQKPNRQRLTFEAFCILRLLLCKSLFIITKFCPLIIGLGLLHQQYAYF